MGNFYIKNHNTKPASASGFTPVNSSKAKLNYKPFSKNLSKEEKLEPYEEAVKANPQYYTEYSREVFEHMKKVERVNSANHGYMDTQTKVTDTMRSILIDWLMEVHLKFELLPETLFLCVNLIDRYMARHQLDSNQFQLLGVSAMLIASKYEEIYAPEVRDFIYATNKTYSGDQILKMEYSILSSLQFEILHVSAFRFLERFHFISHDQTDKKSFFLSQYFLEISLLDYDMLKFSNSLQAAASLYLARKFLKTDPKNSWPSSLSSQSGYSEKDLEECTKDLCSLVTYVLKCKLKTVMRKFQHENYLGVSNLIYDKITSNEKPQAA